jgi:hypothetical protein
MQFVSRLTVVALSLFSISTFADNIHQNFDHGNGNRPPVGGGHGDRRREPGREWRHEEKGIVIADCDHNDHRSHRDRRWGDTEKDFRIIHFPQYQKTVLEVELDRPGDRFDQTRRVDITSFIKVRLEDNQVRLRADLPRNEDMLIMKDYGRNQSLVRINTVLVDPAFGQYKFNTRAEERNYTCEFNVNEALARLPLARAN